MKLAKLALISALALASGAPLFASNPSIVVDSYGIFDPSGRYPIIYQVDIYDTDGDLHDVVVEGYYKCDSQLEQTTNVSGNGSHLHIQGQCNTPDWSTWGTADVMDGSTAVHWDLTFYY